MCNKNTIHVVIEVFHVLTSVPLASGAFEIDNLCTKEIQTCKCQLFVHPTSGLDHRDGIRFNLI